MWHSAARLTSVVLAALVVAAATPVGFRDNAGRAEAPAPEVLRLPAGWQLNRGPLGTMRTELALSPDGTAVVFSATPDGTMEKARLYRQSLDDPAAAAVVKGTPEGVCMPVFSPDGRWIAYWAAKKVYKVPVEGGSPVALSDVADRPAGLSWAPDGRIILGQLAGGLQSVPASGGKPQTLTTIDPATEVTHRLPHVTPDGKGLLFTAMQSDTGLETRLEWLSLETGKRTLLVENAGDGRYLSTGHLVFVRKGTLMTVPFDPGRLRTTGRTMVVVRRLLHAYNSLMRDMHSGAGQYCVSDSGVLIWASGGVVPDSMDDLHWVDRSGRAELWTRFGTRPYVSFRLSPDGRQMAFTITGVEERGIFVYDLLRNRTTRLVPDRSSYFSGPFWSADGKHVAFLRWRATSELWWASAAGKADPHQLAESTLFLRGGSWTRDGRFLAFVEGYAVQSGLDIKLLRMADRRIVEFAATKAAETYPEFSPDGRWMAYVSNETGRNEVYVRSFPDGKRTQQVTHGGATSPLWAPNGRELFYFDIEFKKLTKVDISAGDRLSIRAPRTLFEFSAAPTVGTRGYDITPDGQRFLILKAAAPPPVPTITDLNLDRRWFDRLKRLGSPTS